MTQTRRRALRPALAILASTAVIGSLGQAALSGPASAATTYDAVVLADGPVAYWSTAQGTTDTSGQGHHATAYGGTAPSVALPDGEAARTYDGAGQYLAVPTSRAFSIPTTKRLTWEAWIRPSTLQFTKTSGGYVDVMGKCASYSPTCEWESRMYTAVNSQNRPSRISAYVFNPGAGLGSAADWQPVSGTISADRWIHVVGEYQTVSTPSACKTAYPGTIGIWVDGVKQSFASHAPTGCMSQYSIVPRASSSPMLIGTLAKDTFFAGAIGKVAIYNRLLTQAEISEHFTAMTGLAPAGTCANTCSLTVQPL